MTADALHLKVFVLGAATAYPLPAAGRVTIGRGEGNDVQIDEGSLSRRHAVLHVGPALAIEDLGSANGTVVREPDRPAGPGEVPTDAYQRVQPGRAVAVAPGSHIQLGSTLVVIERGPVPPTTASGPEPPRAAAPRDPRPDDLVVRDGAMERLYALVDRVAASLLSVLVLGETGVGKEVLARTLHARSPRARGPFVGLNCAALRETLLESELFGHEKGSFTGATATKPGLLETANGGTVFLDEIGELPMGVQVTLLRVLEERQVLRVGGLRPRPIDVRFVAATHRDLEREVARGAFRQDLYFRLSGVVLTVPPLRERAGEIAPLAEAFARNACRAAGRASPPALSPEARALLERHPWPGNVRELRNAVERAVVLSGGAVIEPAHLLLDRASGAHAAPSSPATADGPPRASAPTLRPAPDVPEALAPAPGERAPDEPPPKFRTEVAALERQRILEALEHCGGNQTRAAALLGISRRTLVTRLDAYGIRRPRKPSGGAK